MMRLIFCLLISTVVGGHQVFALDLIGYVPYYRINANYLNTLRDQLPLLHEVRYFGLSVNSTGGITSQAGSVASQKSNIAAIKSMIDELPEGQRPRLNITLGGAGVDSVFSSVVANAGSREALADNIVTLFAETGAMSVDIDWEHPDAGIERTTHYPALLKKIKEKVGTANRVYATVDPTVMIPSSVFAGVDGIDGISLMTYDLGWWGNDPTNPFRGEHSLNEYVEDAINAWTDPASANSQRPYVWSNASWGNNTPGEKLGVGLPFYGRNISNGAAYTYADILSLGTPTGNGYYTLDGQSIWIPDQATIEARVQMAYDEGLQHIIIWELAQDINPSNANSMLRIAAEKLASLTRVSGDFNGDGAVGADDLLQWQSDYGLNDESDADGDGDSDGRDFLIWQQNFAPPASLVAAANVVPEPATILLGGALLGLLCIRPQFQYRLPDL